MQPDTNSGVICLCSWFGDLIWHVSFCYFDVDTLAFRIGRGSVLNCGPLPMHLAELGVTCFIFWLAMLFNPGSLFVLTGLDIFPYRILGVNWPVIMEGTRSKTCADITSNCQGEQRQQDSACDTVNQLPLYTEFKHKFGACRRRQPRLGCEG